MIQVSLSDVFNSDESVREFSIMSSLESVLNQVSDVERVEISMHIQYTRIFPLFPRQKHAMLYIRDSPNTLKERSRDRTTTEYLVDQC